MMNYLYTLYILQDNEPSSDRQLHVVVQSLTHMSTPAKLQS